MSYDTRAARREKRAGAVAYVAPSIWRPWRQAVSQVRDARSVVRVRSAGELLRGEESSAEDDLQGEYGSSVRRLREGGIVFARSP